MTETIPQNVPKMPTVTARANTPKKGTARQKPITLLTVWRERGYEISWAPRPAIRNSKLRQGCGGGPWGKGGGEYQVDDMGSIDSLGVGWLEYASCSMGSIIAVRALHLTGVIARCGGGRIMEKAEAMITVGDQGPGCCRHLGSATCHLRIAALLFQFSLL